MANVVTSMTPEELLAAIDLYVTRTELATEAGHAWHKAREDDVEPAIAWMLLDRFIERHNECSHAFRQLKALVRNRESAYMAEQRSRDRKLGEAIAATYDDGPKCAEKGTCECFDGCGACDGCGRWLGEESHRIRRLAICGACGCERTVTEFMRRDRESQFTSRPNEAADSFYCGCQNDDDF